MQLAQNVKAALKKDFDQQKKYYDYLRTKRPELFIGFDGDYGEAARNETFLRVFDKIVSNYEPETAKPTTEGPVNITKPAGPDSINKKDSVKKLK
jgi:hypothetical protein